jgi:signal transduction histidine kinase
VSAAPAGRTKIVELAVAAGRDVERLLADPALVGYVSERVAVADLLAPWSLARQPLVAVSVEPGLELECDPTRLRQALANLVGNAERHGASVTITAVHRGDAILIDVADDGPGVPTDVDPFVRGLSGTGSTGIGAWLARQIAEAHGGSLELMPSERGAAFRLSLPSSGAGS